MNNEIFQIPISIVVLSSRGGERSALVFNKVDAELQKTKHLLVITLLYSNQIISTKKYWVSKFQLGFKQKHVSFRTYGTTGVCFLVSYIFGTNITWRLYRQNQRLSSKTVTLSMSHVLAAKVLFTYEFQFLHRYHQNHYMNRPLREKCPNMELYRKIIQENTDQK